MPLLNNEAFTRSKLSPSLHPNDEVFFCSATTEAFTNYDDYFERTILCSSMVWTCSVTGKGELTFQEAVASEASAMNIIDTLSPGLQKAMLYLTIIVETSNFKDICHFVYTFCSRRFFVGEKVEASTMFGKKMACIARVIPPSRSTLESADNDICFGIDPDLYKYEIVSAEPGSKFKMIVGTDRVSRPKAVLTKDKIKLFLKQHCIITKRGKETEVKDSSIDKFNLSRTSWENIFAGPQPNLDPEDDSLPSRYKPKGKNTSSSDNKKSSPDEKRNKPGPKPLSEEEKKKRHEERKLARAEAKKSAREKAREEKQRQEKLMKERNRKRDDLECDDLKPLPLGMPISCPIPPSVFGDALMILEFYNNFEEFFDLREIFPHGFTFELLVKCLTEKSIKSCISDLLRITLATLFCLQEEEQAEDKKDKKEEEDSTVIQVTKNEDPDDDDNCADSLKSAVRAANIANSSLKSLIGAKFSAMKMNAFTITEVLRQHLLTAGTYRVRSIYRGWYCTREDPALILKMEHPEIMERLAKYSIYDLDVDERISIFQVLVHEIMSFPSFREILETNIDNIVELRKEIRSTGAEFARWEKENILSLKQKKETDSQEDSQQSQQEATEKYSVEKEKRVTKLDQLHFRLRQKIRSHEAQYGLKPLGRDRAYRRYWVFNSLPGLLVERDDPLTGSCVIPDPKSPSASPANNKENEFDPRPRKSSISKKVPSSSQRGMECNGDENSCPVHCLKIESYDDKWVFYTSPEEVDQLIEAMNDRGFRESELKKVLEKDKEFILENISKCPLWKLNSCLAQDETKQKPSRLVYYRPADHIQFEDRKPSEGLLLSFLEVLETFDEQLYSSGLSFRLNASMTHEEWKASLSKIDPKKPSATKEVSQLLIKLAQNIVAQHLTPPLAGENGSLAKWMESVNDFHSVSQLFFLLDVLDGSVNWSRSALSAYCRVCKRKKDAANMLICDSCNRGHHTYCLKPALDEIPAGEWFCQECKPKVKMSPRKQPPRQVKEQDSDVESVAGTVSDVDEVMDVDSATEEEGEEESASDSESRSSTLRSEDTCVVCGSNDDEPDIECGQCQKKYHISCHSTKVSSRRNFVCNSCVTKGNKNGEKRKTNQEENVNEDDEKPKRKRVLRFVYDDDEQQQHRTTTGRRKEFVDLIVCSEILNKLQENKSSRMFMKHPSEKEAPGYKKAVSSHMDLAMIERNLKEVNYKTNREFVEDVRSIFINCQSFYHRSSDQHKAGKELASLFEGLVGKLFPKLVSSHDE